MVAEKYIIIINSLVDCCRAMRGWHPWTYIRVSGGLHQSYKIWNPGMCKAMKSGSLPVV